MPGLDLAQHVPDIVGDRRRPPVQIDDLDPVEYHRVGELSSGFRRFEKLGEPLLCSRFILLKKR